MRQFEKGRQQIIYFLVFYVLFSMIAGLMSLKYLQPKFININYVLLTYSILNIVIGILVYIYTKKRFKAAGDIEDNYTFLSEHERKERESKELEKQERELNERRKEIEKKKISEQVTEILDPIQNEINIQPYLDKLLINISKTINIVQGVAYVLDRETNQFGVKGTYAFYTNKTDCKFELGEGIPGQVAKDQKILQLDNIPENYIKVESGLGSSSPNNLIVIPIVNDNETIGVLELASFERTNWNLNELYSQFNAKIGPKVAELLK